MTCDLCKNKEASVHVKQVCEGSVKELFVCASCAAQKGLDAQSPLSLTNFLFGVGMPGEPAPAGADRTCRTCGLRQSEFRKTTRLGCADCYETFHDELESVLAGMHPGREHAGKTPARAKAAANLARLQTALAQAVSGQRFEEAARLRDQIGAIKQAPHSIN